MIQDSTGKKAHKACADLAAEFPNAHLAKVWLHVNAILSPIQTRKHKEARSWTRFSCVPESVRSRLCFLSCAILTGYFDASIGGIERGVFEVGPDQAERATRGRSCEKSAGMAQ